MNDTNTPAAPRGPARQITVRLYDEADAARFDALASSRFEGKTGVAAAAVFAAGLDALADAAPAVPDSLELGTDAIAIKQLTRPDETGDSPADSALDQPDSPPPRQASEPRRGGRWAGLLAALALAVSLAALAVAIYRPATPVDFATKAEVAELGKRIDTDLDDVADLLGAHRDRLNRLEKLPAIAPGR